MDPFFIGIRYRGIPMEAYFSDHGELYLNASRFCNCLGYHDLKPVQSDFGVLKRQKKNLFEMINEQGSIRFAISKLTEFDIPPDFTIEDLIDQELFKDHRNTKPCRGIYVPPCIMDLIIADYLDTDAFGKACAIYEMMDLQPTLEYQDFNDDVYQAALDAFPEDFFEEDENGDLHPKNEEK